MRRRTKQNGSVVSTTLWLCGTCKPMLRSTIREEVEGPDCLFKRINAAHVHREKSEYRGCLAMQTFDHLLSEARVQVSWPEVGQYNELGCSVTSTNRTSRRPSGFESNIRICFCVLCSASRQQYSMEAVAKYLLLAAFRPRN